MHAKLTGGTFARAAATRAGAACVSVTPLAARVNGAGARGRRACRLTNRSAGQEMTYLLDRDGAGGKRVHNLERVSSEPGSATHSGFDSVLWSACTIEQAGLVKMMDTSMVRVSCS
jgi:hypothetical protein